MASIIARRKLLAGGPASPHLGVTALFPTPNLVAC